MKKGRVFLLVGSSIILFLGASFLVLSSRFLSSGDTQVHGQPNIQSNAAAQHLYELKMVNSHNGWALSRFHDTTVVLYTSNSGHTWTHVGPTNVRLPSQISVSFANDSTAALLFGAPATLSHHLYVTTDTGRIWSVHTLSPSRESFYPSYVFANARGVWVSGNTVYPDTLPPPHEILLKLSHGKKLVPIGPAPRGIQWFWLSRSGNGLLWSAFPDDIVYRTSNAGRSWIAIRFPFLHGQPNSLEFPFTPVAFNKDKVVFLLHYTFATGRLSVLRSQNDLRVWHVVYETPPQSPRNAPVLTMISSHMWWLFYQHTSRTLWFTTNGGKSWTHYHANVDLRKMKDLQFTSKEVGFGILQNGSKNTLMTTQNGGKTWHVV